MTTPSLRLERISHWYGRLNAVSDVSLSVDPGELVCLLGPSGCGKTTVLRVAAGLESLQAGRVLLDERPVADGAGEMPPEDRSVGLVFQDYALFPHLSVRQNVMFGLRGLAKAERRRRAEATLHQVGMREQADAYPHMLSGGQQQRVAVARALAPQPHVMLLDEPFSGLDVTLRHQVRDETLHILKASGAATLMVTHDPEEAMFMADRVALMRDGRLEQVGPPPELYNAPASRFVASFFGEVNRIPAVVHGGSVDTPLGSLDAARFSEGTPVEVLVRPEALRLQPLGAGANDAAASARVLTARLLGRSSMVHLSVPPARMNGHAPRESTDLHLHARIPGRFLPSEETQLAINLDRSQAFVFPQDEAAG
jgi:iron(III) transport system ATP-binding protein